MKQLCLLPVVPDTAPLGASGRRPHGVRETSVAQFQVAVDSGMLEGRKRDTLAWLEKYLDTFTQPPTSAELADWAFGYANVSSMEHHRFLFYVRRGLSDLQQPNCGLVESVPQGKRICSVNHNKVETWRVKSR